ncbi:MAG: hypothetical protein R3C28_13030 [Pirellulaceae bacterium]
MSRGVTTNREKKKILQIAAQRDFDGQPLSLDEVAAPTGQSKSTISRVVRQAWANIFPRS